jgi:hypothetical protein
VKEGTASMCLTNPCTRQDCCEERGDSDDGGNDDSGGDDGSGGSESDIVSSSSSSSRASGSSGTAGTCAAFACVSSVLKADANSIPCSTTTDNEDTECDNSMCCQNRRPTTGQFYEAKFQLERVRVHTSDGRMFLERVAAEVATTMALPRRRLRLWYTDPVIDNLVRISCVMYVDVVVVGSGATAGDDAAALSPADASTAFGKLKTAVEQAQAVNTRPRKAGLSDGGILERALSYSEQQVIVCQGGKLIEGTQCADSPSSTGSASPLFVVAILAVVLGTIGLLVRMWRLGKQAASRQSVVFLNMQQET